MIWCVGAGPGDLGFLTRRGQELIEQADVVAGFTAVVDLIRSLVNPNARIVTMGYKDQVERLGEVARFHRTGAKCVVVFMGDLHFSGFQFLERVERACQHQVETIPGISSAQILASRNAIVIPRPWDFMPAAVAKLLLAKGISPNHPTEVWEHLTQSEAVWKGLLGGCTLDFSDMSIMLIRAQNPLPSQLEPVSSAIVDVHSRCESPSLFDASAEIEGHSEATGNADNFRSWKLRLP